MKYVKPDGQRDRPEFLKLPVRVSDLTQDGR
jgi:hypothetical protein